MISKKTYTTFALVVLIVTAGCISPFGTVEREHATTNAKMTDSGLTVELTNQHKADRVGVWLHNDTTDNEKFIGNLNNQSKLQINQKPTGNTSVVVRSFTETEVVVTNVYKVSTEGELVDLHNNLSAERYDTSKEDFLDLSVTVVNQTDNKTTYKFTRTLPGAGDVGGPSVVPIDSVKSVEITNSGAGYSEGKKLDEFGDSVTLTVKNDEKITIVGITHTGQSSVSYTFEANAACQVVNDSDMNGRETQISKCVLLDNP